MGLTTTAQMDKINLNPGALGAEETRQSIPNLAVKLCCGDNTAGGALWEDSSAPGPHAFFLFLSKVDLFKVKRFVSLWLQLKACGPPGRCRQLTGEEGLEPPTPRFVAACSNPLSYTPFSSGPCVPMPMASSFKTCAVGSPSGSARESVSV